MAKAEKIAEATWSAECDLSTLVEAEKIKGNPKRHAAALKVKKARIEALNAVGKEGK